MYLRIIIAAFCIVVMFPTMQAQVRILTIGDSTMADYDEEKNSGEREKRGWAQMLPVFLKDDVKLNNAARNGRSSKSFYYEFWRDLRETLKPGDYVFIQFGHNDEKADGKDTDENDHSQRGTAAWGQYQKYLGKYIAESRERGAIPVLLTPVVRRLFNEDNEITGNGLHNLTELAPDDSTMNYPAAMRALAKELSVPLVDMTVLTEKLVKDYGAEKSKQVIYAQDDNTHLKAMGGILFSKLAVEDLLRQNILTGYLTLQTGVVIKPSVYDFGTQFIGKSSVKPFSIVGIDLYPESGEISIKSEQLRISQSANGNSFGRELHIPYEGGNINTQIFIQFTPEREMQLSEKIPVLLNGKESSTLNITGNGISGKGAKDVSISWMSLNSKDRVEGINKGKIFVGLSEIKDGIISLIAPLGNVWPAGEIDMDALRYIEYNISMTSGTLYIDSVMLELGAVGGKEMNFTALGFINNDYSNPVSFAVMEPLKDGNTSLFISGTAIKVEEGDTFRLRIYPWYKRKATDKYIVIKDAKITGLFFEGK